MKTYLKKCLKRILVKSGYKLTRINNVSCENGCYKVSSDENDTFNTKASRMESTYNNLSFADQALEKLISSFEFDTVLDIGSGEGKHSGILLDFDKKVTSIDFGTSVYFEKRNKNYTYIKGDYYTYDFPEPFDAIWASHVLEHQPNPNLFLKKIHSDLKEGGILVLTVPPLKHEIVGGHVTLWNAGLLMYQLVLAGFDCSGISIKSYGYNISVILIKKSILKYPDLSYDSGDINKLKDFFPEGLGEPFGGNIKELNW